MEELFDDRGEAAELVPLRRRRAEQLSGKDAAITAADCKVGITNHAVEHQKVGLQAVGMLKMPRARLSGKFLNQAKAHQVLRPAIADRVALRRIGAGERRSEQGPE